MHKARIKPTDSEEDRLTICLRQLYFLVRDIDDEEQLSHLASLTDHLVAWKQYPELKTIAEDFSEWAALKIEPGSNQWAYDQARSVCGYYADFADGQEKTPNSRHN
jgi:hypothetical protein